MTWRFSDFYVKYNEWVDGDNPPPDFRFWVMAWLYELQEDPYVHATPAHQLGDPWYFVRVPYAEDGTHAVVSLYSVEGDHVRCSGITTLRKPII